MLNKRVLSERELLTKPIINKLPRKSNYLPNTSVGKILVFFPTEVLKDTINKVWGIPDYFIAPDEFIPPRSDLYNYASPEFLAFSKFRNDQKATIICTKRQETLIRENLELSIKPCSPMIPKINYETYFKPEDKQLAPVFEIESNYLSRTPEIDDLINFKTFSDDNKVIIRKFNSLKEIIGEVTITKTGLNKVHVLDNYRGIDYGNFELDYTPPEKYTQKYKSIVKDYCQEKNILLVEGNTLYGKMIILGSSSGLDLYDKGLNPRHRYGSTTGVAYFNTQGDCVLVDPPINTIYLLLDNRINLHSVKAILITHAHEDHSGGLFQTVMSLPQSVPVYLLADTRIRETRKTCNNLNSSKNTDDPQIYFTDLEKMIDFRDVHMRQDWEIIPGLFFELFFSWHSIPTLGYYIKSAKGTYLEYWSGDTQLSELRLNKAVENFCMTPERRDQLLHIKKCLHYSIEMGFPTYFHNSSSTLENFIKLNQLDPHTVNIVHFTNDPEIKNVSLATPGMIIDLSDPAESDLQRSGKEIINLINSVPGLQQVFKEVESLSLLLNEIKVVTFENGQIIFSKDDPADATYFLLDGGGHLVFENAISPDDFKQATATLDQHNNYPGLIAFRYHRGTLLGEGCFTPEKKRTRYVYAVNKPRYLKIGLSTWEKIINSDSKAAKEFKNILEIRRLGLPYSVAKSEIFAEIDLPEIENFISRYGRHEIWKAGEYLIRQRQPLDQVYILLKGKVRLTQQKDENGQLSGEEIILKDNLQVEERSMGYFFGEMSLLEGSPDHKTGRGLPKNNVIITSPEAEVISINKKDFETFANEHPRIELNMTIAALLRKTENKELIMKLANMSKKNINYTNDGLIVTLKIDYPDSNYRSPDAYKAYEDLLQTNGNTNK